MRLRSQLILLTAARLLLNTAARLIFPFKPEIRRGLGVSVAQFDQIVALGSLAGLLGPWLAPLSERFGRRRLLAAMLLVFSLGCGIAAGARGALWFGAALLLITLGKVVYDPIMQTHLGDTVPYGRRSRAIAVTELAWSLALLVGAPLAGVLIGRFGWNAPYVVLAVLGVAVAPLLARRLPESRPADGRRPDVARRLLEALRGRPGIFALAGAMLLAMAANQMLFISYAEWLQERFQLSLGQLGLTAFVIGSAELLGEGIVGWAGDRVGKRRLVLWAGALSAPAYLAVPFLDAGLASVMGAIFVVFVLFEITFVGLVPIFTELTPQARSASLAVFALTLPLGRTVGSLAAAPVQALGGMTATGIVAAATTLLVVLAIALTVRE